VPELLVVAVVAAGDMERVHAVVADGADLVEITGERIGAFVAAVREAYPELGVLGLGPVEDSLVVSLTDSAGDLARAAVFGWLGVRVFRVLPPGRVLPVRRALNMVSAIRGDSPPAHALRGLA
jgi:hypothetical protein